MSNPVEPVSSLESELIARYNLKSCLPADPETVDDSEDLPVAPKPNPKPKAKRRSISTYAETTTHGGSGSQRVGGVFLGAIGTLLPVRKQSTKSRKPGKSPLAHGSDTDRASPERVAAWKAYYEPGGEGYRLGYLEAKRVFIANGQTLGALAMAVQEWGMDGAESTERQKSMVMRYLLEQDGLLVVKVKLPMGRHKMVQFKKHIKETIAKRQSA